MEMALALSTPTLVPKPFVRKRPSSQLWPLASKLRPYLRVSSSPSPIPDRVFCQAAQKSSPSNKPPPSPEPPTLLDEAPAEEYFRPPLPGDRPDFWEGSGWDALGFVVQYLWAIGIVVALVGCGVAAKTYNLGATDFKETPVFKEAMKAQGILESPADSKIFEESSKEAPSVQENPS